MEISAALPFKKDSDSGRLHTWLRIQSLMNLKQRLKDYMAKSCNAYTLALLKICQKRTLENIHSVDGPGNVYQMHKTIKQMGWDGERQR